MDRRFRPVCLFLPLLLLVALIPSLRAEPPAPAGAELLLRGNDTSDNADPTLLTPTSAFELRAPTALVAADQVGQPAAESPLVFTPALPGAFRWTSQRGGVFTPSEPPPLGTNYKVTLAPGFKDADGKPVRAGFAGKFHVPSLEVRSAPVGSNDSTEPVLEPRVQLVFNAAVDPERIAKSLSYRLTGNAASVPATVVAATDKDPFPFAPKVPRQTWRELFFLAHAPSAKAGVAAPAAPALNRVVVAPAKPLPPGKKWRLVAAAGLPAAEPGVTLPAAVEMAAGDVEPFEVKEIEATNDGAKARRMVINFTRGLDKSVTADNVGHWVKLSPEPANMKLSLTVSERFGSNYPVEVEGDFETDKPYTVTVGAGLPSAGKFYRMAETKRIVQFDSETPQIASTDYNIDQLSAGRREFALSARNAAEIRVRAKLVAPEQAAQALIAYKNRHHDPKTHEFVDGPVPFDKFPGKAIYDKTVPGSTAQDEPATVPLRWDNILGAHRNGIVLLEAEQTHPTKGQTKRAGAQVMVQVTDLGVVWKISRSGEVLAYVFSMANAAPVQASVRALDTDGKPLVGRRDAPVSTRADGVATLPAGTDQAAWLSVTTADGDCHALPFGRNRRNSLGLYRFHLPPSAYPPVNEATDNEGDDESADADDSGAPAAKAAPKPPRREVVMFSERGVYKPGEEAHVKAIVREWRGGAPDTVKAGTPATLRAFDAKGRRFWQKDSFLSAAGSLSETIPLPKSCLGGYRVEIAFDGKTAAEDTGLDYVDENSQDDSGDSEDEDDTATNVCRFQVQEYVPNAFLVTLAKPKERPIGAGAVPVALSARYYMGKTLSRAQAVWSLKAEDSTFAPDGFDDYTFGSDDLDQRFERKPGELALDGKGALSDKGELALSPQIVLNTASPGPRRVRMQASVTDQDQQTVSTHTAFTVHSSEFYLGVRDMPEVVRAGEPLPLEVIAVRPDEQPVAEPVKLTAKLSRLEWRTNRVANDTGNSDYDSRADMIPVGSVEGRSTGVRKIGKSWQPAEADAPLVAGQVPAPTTPGSLVPTEPGEYALVVTAQDKAGRAVQTALTFTVLGDKEAEWGLKNAWQLPLVPDKAEYHPGDKATILLKTPISGRALVTVEREGVSRAFVVEVAKEHPAVEVPILPSDTPNMYVCVVLLRGLEQSPRKVKEPEYRAGYCQILVPRADTKLAVEVRSGQPEYQPGEEASVEVAVTDEAHRPAPGAEVTLYAVDKGVLSLTGYQTPNLFKTFYHPRPLDVQTGLTLPDLLSEDPEDLDFSGEKGATANKGYLVGGGGESANGDRLRQNFVACAYWNATLVTDADGKVRAKFPVPDSLTEYNVMAVVGSAARFGSGQGAFRVNKPLMLEPALPRFGNVGDHTILRAVVHNQSPAAGEAEVTLELDDKATLEAPSSRAPKFGVHLAAGESKTVDIPVTFTHTGEASWTWRAQMTGDGPEKKSYRDSVRSTLLVDHPVPRRSEVLHARVDGGRADDLLGKINPELLEGQDGIVRVSVSTSRLGEIAEGVNELLHYPYGCVEQTTSSLLPWLVLKDFQDAFPGLNHTPAERDEVVAKGVNRILGMQTEGGGLAYWPEVGSVKPSPWGSAYGGLGLALAKKSGYYVPPASFKKLCEYLSENLRSDKPAEHDTYGDHSETDRILALYTLAVAGKGEASYYETFYAKRDTLCPEDRTLLALAIAEDKGSADMVRALLQPGPRDKERPETWNAFANSAALDAMRLLVWCRFQPQDPAVETRLTRLLDDRTGRGAWETTQGNAWALLAMTAYARDVEKPAAGASGTVTLAGQGKPFEVKGRAAMAVCEFPLDAAAMGKEKLALAAVGGTKAGRLYVQTRVESRPRGDALTLAPTNGQGGYIIRRQYEKLRDDGTAVAAENLRVGDRVLVSLLVEAPDRASYVAIDDPLPSVLEAINPEFKTSGADANVPKDGVQSWVSDFRELRTDRAVFFCDSLGSGHFKLQYLARVRAAGAAVAPAAKIEEMYHPNRYAETAAASLSTKALE